MVLEALVLGMHLHFCKLAGKAEGQRATALQRDQAFHGRWDRAGDADRQCNDESGKHLQRE